MFHSVSNSSRSSRADNTLPRLTGEAIKSQIKQNVKTLLPRCPKLLPHASPFLFILLKNKTAALSLSSQLLFTNLNLSSSSTTWPCLLILPEYSEPFPLFSAQKLYLPSRPVQLSPPLWSISESDCPLPPSLCFCRILPMPQNCTCWILLLLFTWVSPTACKHLKAGTGFYSFFYCYPLT